MGIYNRDYFRDDAPDGDFRPAVHSEWAIKFLVALNVAVFFAQNLTSDADPFGRLIGGVTQFLTLDWESLRSGEIWRVVTYGFCHADFRHLFFNMIGLWIFGRVIEPVYGSRELLAFFLTAVVFSGLAEVGIRALPSSGGNSLAIVLGASGGVVGIVTLSAMVFPHMRVGFLFLPITIEARWLAIGYVLLDVMRVVSGTEGIASYAHLAGALTAGVYYVTGFRFLGARSRMRTVARTGWWTRLKRRFKRPPGIQIYQPPAVDEPARMERLKRDVDRLLDKMNRDGMNSLTKEEQKFLKEASAEYARWSNSHKSS